ncbi:UDP-glucose 4-epimerase GalE [Elioraea sp.]|uniref:UDP-glucose 4-epimerase GalE n=1 Tax=Elioraea sp. TaxID=2185103 RepID=UPI0025C27DD2|nr:UDP-glucose 4-epimerase GalE [Elioraea sp.]
MTGRYLVTGGAGFVGSHLVLALLRGGANVTILDDLTTGHERAVPKGAQFVRGSVADPDALARAFSQGPFDAVFHFASLTLVGESMREPVRYIAENVAGAAALVQACVTNGVTRIVVSSTANLFAEPARIPIDEDEAVIPGSPYGESKAMLERILYWADQIHGLRGACLRYFNAAGADHDGSAGEDHRPETHLIPLVLDAAAGRRPALTVFGDDYPTADGTCIRDYIHVADLATAHLAVLEPLRTRSVRYNLGIGQGHSVREVIAAAEAVTGMKVPHTIGPRRAGDPAVLVAASARIRRELGWQPRFERLETIVSHAWAWRKANPNGYG